MFKRLFKLVLWPVKDCSFSIKVFAVFTLIFIAIVLFFQYRADYEVDTSPFKGE